jgi:hypothetical protein
MMRFPTQKAFAKFLIAKADSEVGFTGASNSCPLAICLAARGARQPYVFHRVWGSADIDHRPLPLWAREFVRRCGRKFAFNNELTAQEALAILNRPI